MTDIAPFIGISVFVTVLVVSAWVLDLRQDERDHR